MTDLSDKTSRGAFAVSMLSLILSGMSYYSTYQRDQRELAAKRPVVEVRTIEKASRAWGLAVTISNRSDERIKVVGFAIPEPKGGYIKLTQTVPDGKFQSGADLNSETKQATNGHPFNPGQEALYFGKYSIADAFAAPPDVALTLNVTIRYLGAKERDETLTVTRTLN